MLYGHDKRRQMARSILPSTSRVLARRHLDGIRRANRRAVHQDLRAAFARLDFDDLDVATHDRNAAHETRELVSRRRASDKLNHFERWALATTTDMPVSERLSRLRAALPDGLIGEHTMSHLRWIEAIRPRHEHEQPLRRYTPQSVTERPAIHAALDNLLRAGHHGTINRALKAGGADRLLLGRHDLDTFVVETVNCHHHACNDRWCHHPTLDALRAFLR